MSKQTYARAKRLIDLGCATGWLVLSAPLMFVIGVLIKLDSPGPVLFRQARLGCHRRIFMCYKFRTMYLNGAGQGPKPARDDDGRLTRVGRWLRRTSLDELPQFLNVLRGEMSLVGPRPEQEYLAERYPECAQRRFEVLPGLTGWWQVNGRLQPMYEHLDYDLYYVDHQSLWLDLLILWRTIGAVISGKGAI